MNLDNKQEKYIFQTICYLSTGTYGDSKKYLSLLLST
jgi:hypothetical protein